MNTKEYIESGILENYVAGLVSDQERREVECLSKIYPEIKEELDALEVTMEQFAQSQAVTPPLDMKDSILGAIEGLDPDEKQEKVRVVSMNDSTQAAHSPRRINWVSIAAAILVVAVGAWAFSIQSSLRETQSKLAEIESQNSDLYAELSDLELKEKELESQLSITTNPAFTQIVMGGLEISPDAKSTIFWNESSGEVHLIAGSLPSAPDGKQYQLWAIVDGAPVDMGVFESGQDSLQKMFDVTSPQAFAVTLEVHGGSPVPTMDQMFVLGAVES